MEVIKMLTLGYQIKQARKRAGLTQEQLAKLTNLSRPHIGGIETNRYTPSIATLQLIADILNVKVAELVEDKGVSINSNINDDEMNLVLIYRDLADNDKVTIKNLVTSLRLANKQSKSVKSSTLPITGIMKQKTSHAGLAVGGYKK